MSITCHADDDAPLAAEPADSLISFIDRSSNRSAAPFEVHIRFLAELKGDGGDALKFYLGCIERVRDSGDPACVPALEKLLNIDEIWDPRNSHDRIYSLIRNGLHAPATQAWYQLRWIDLDRRTRIATALYGLSPTAPVKVEQQVSVERFHAVHKESATDARAALYELLSSDVKMPFNHLWSRQSMYAAVELLQVESFRPTQEEIDRILKTDESYGLYVMLGYVCAISPDDKPADRLRELLMSQTGQYYKVAVLCHFAEQFKNSNAQVRDNLIDTLIAVGNRVQEEIRQGNLDTEQPYALGPVCFALAKLGRNEKTVAYMKAFNDFVDTTDWTILSKWDQWYRDGYRMSLLGFRDFNKGVLVNWSGGGESR